MKFNPLKMLTPQMKKLLLGGLVGSLTYYGDLAVSDVAGYPAELKAHLAPQLPRNDELLTLVAAPAAMYMLGKKKPKIKELSKGTILYSVPRLVQRVAVNTALSIATPASASRGVGMRVIPSFAPSASKIYPNVAQANAPSVPSVAVGKYR